MQALENALDILAVLKAATASQHKNIERLLPFFDERLSLEVYTSTLSAFLGFYGPIELRLSSITGWQTIGIDLAHRQRAHLLQADLQALQMGGSIIALLPECQELPKIDNLFDALGCMYVLEGSTLGGQLIARELERRFGVTRQSGAAFFHGYGPDTGPMWMVFCSAIRICVDDHGRQQATVTAAQNTFACFAKWIERLNSHVK